MIVLPMPPSVNVAYRGLSQGRFKSKAYKDWEKLCQTYQNIVTGEAVGEYSVEYRFFSKWYNKDGSIKIKDVHNYQKCLDDYLQKIIPGFDDCMIFESHIKKIHSDREEVEIELKEKK
jgi:Holliday junction resolvase RusA-like endonuclease